MSYFLVLTPVRELRIGDTVYDEHGERRVTAIRGYKDSSYLTFSEGPANFYLDSELMPTERMS